ncbi:MAG: DUF1800 domain-containing protein, partial [Bacteroidota bacterium]
MNRRDFLKWSPSKSDGAASLLSGSSDLTPYVPRPDKPWNARRAAHLLRRTGFGPQWAELDSAMKSTPAAIVDLLLDNSGTQPTMFQNWTTDDPFDDSIDPEVRQQFYTTWLRDLQFWWINMILLPGPTRLREKMVLFWHGHFVSEFTKVEVTQYMYIQNRLFREYAFGSFKELARKISTDPAMVIYLDGAGNKAESPNENYARELMELFTLGTGTYKDGTPHYSENDIVELARALTGWTPKGLGSEFHPDQFDSGKKTFFGETANFGLDDSAEKNPIDLIFAQNDTDAGQKRAAIFICSKLYQFFVYEIPDMSIVTEMAKTLEANDWNIAPVLRQLFLSEHFFDDNVIGGMLKSPVDFVMGMMSSLNLLVSVNADPGDPITHDPLRAMAALSQVIMSPPNVKGWPGGKSWISTATLPLRVRYTKLWIQPPDPLPDNAATYNFKPDKFILSLPDNGDVHLVLDHLLELLLPIDISDRAKKGLLDILLGGAPDYEWKPEDFVAKIRACMVKLAALA